MTRYSTRDPFAVHVGDHGAPYMLDKANNRIGHFHAEQQFKSRVTAMRTWASRAFGLAAAEPDPDLRAAELQRLEWTLDDIAAWLAAMRAGLAETRGRQRERDTIDKLLALANDAGASPGEADNARRMADKRAQRL